MNVSRKNELKQNDLLAGSWKCAQRTIMALCFVAMLYGVGATAEPRTVTSNTQVLLDATLLDSNTGEDVELFGLIHVQTKVRPSESTLAVHANIREEAFLAFIDLAPPTNPFLEQLEALKEQARDVKSQIVALQQQILELMNELQTVLVTDTNPFIPGTQIDQEKAADLQRRIQQLSTDLKRLQSQLSDIANEMKDLLDQINAMQEGEEDPPELVSIYSAAGAVSVGPSICDHIVCKRFIDLRLISADGDILPFEVRLDLQLTPGGSLLLANAVVDDGSTDSDDDVDGT